MFVKNPVVVFATLGSATEGMLVAGFATFIPKYVQTVFSVTPATAALQTGAIPLKHVKIEINIFSARVRSTMGGYVFTGVCLLTPGRGYLPPARVDTPPSQPS